MELYKAGKKYQKGMCIIQIKVANRYKTVPQEGAL